MTVNEIETKRIALEAEQATALEASKVLSPGTAEFDDAYGRYLGAKANIAKIPAEVAAAKLAENADAIKAASATAAEAISQVLTGLKVEELIGVPVVNLNFAVDSEGKALVVFNPVVRTKSATTGTKEPKAGGRTFVTDPQGNRLSLTKFVVANATEAEKASAEFKYPHTRADSKPKFEEFCTAHNLTGFTYEVPGKPEEPAS